MSPRQLRNGLLRNWVGVAVGEGPHVDQAAGAEPAHAWKLGPKIRREPVDDPGSPPLGLLAVQDPPADRPVQADQLGVHHSGCPDPGLRDLGLHRREQVAVPVRESIDLGHW